jgi:hypothetical protein
MSRCLVCGEKNLKSKGNDNSNLILLNDSRYIHQDCLSKSQIRLNGLKIELDKLSKQIDNYNSNLWNKLFGKSSEIKNDLENKYYSINKSYEKLHRGFDKVCVSYPGYPPDWNERRELAKNRDGKKCVKCISSFQLHTHHKTALSKGGSNSLDNLITLCKQCHLKEHNTKSFGNSSSGPGDLSEFHKKHKLLKSCIDESCEINFNYWKLKEINKKLSKEISKRHLKPHKIDTVKDGLKMVGDAFLKSDNKGFFVYGFDFDRKADRFFDISKMSRIKKIH